MLRRWLVKEPVLCVSIVLAAVSALFVPPGEKYIRYIDFKTLACLWGLMAALKGFETEGLLRAVSLRLAGAVKTARSLALLLVFLCFASAMLMTNDVALIALVPITLTIMPLCGLDRYTAPVVVLETIAANIGSSLTPIGNPQNLFLFNRFAIPMPLFFQTTLPYVLLGGLLLALCCLFLPAARVSSRPQENKTPVRKPFVALYAALFAVAVLAVFQALPDWVMVAVLLVSLLLANPKLLLLLDYSLLATFVAIFVFVGNLAELEPVRAFLSRFAERSTFLAAVATSQFTSNVPAAVLLSGFTDNARALLAGVNVGGLGTLIASMASVISFKLYARERKRRTGRYLLCFTALNIAFLAALTLLWVLL